MVRLNETNDQTKALTGVKEIIAANINEIGQLKRIIATRSGKVFLIGKNSSDKERNECIQRC